MTKVLSIKFILPFMIFFQALAQDYNPCETNLYFIMKKDLMIC